MAELVLALDYPNAEPALDMARRVAGEVPWAKVGLELFTAAGPDVVRRLKNMGFKVFLDLKCLDIPNTVAGAVRAAAGLRADLLTVHASGGRRMLEAAVAARDQVAAVAARDQVAAVAAKDQVAAVSARDQATAMVLDETAAPLMRLFAVTVLTSQDASDLGLPGPDEVAALVMERARLAAACGLDGVVCSGLEVARIKKEITPRLRCLTPGIRPAGADDDQRRVVTPERAVRDGADLLVVGRPITQAGDPVGAARAILAQMTGSAV